MKPTIAISTIFALAAVANAAPTGTDSCSDTTSTTTSSTMAPCATPSPNPTPDVPLQAPGPDSSAQCSHGEWECQGDNVAQCNWGTWNVFNCTAGTRCVPNDWECVFEADWQSVYDQFNPTTTESSSTALSAPSPTPAPEAPSGSCTNGEFQCDGDNVIQCNIDHWVIWPCANGTSCMPNDYECVPQNRWNDVYNSIPANKNSTTA